MQIRLLAVALMAAATACSGGRTGVLSIKSIDDQRNVAAADALARGDLLFARGEYALALDAFRKAVRQDAGDAHGLNGVAISYAAIGRHDLAREYFELALARAPHDGRIYRNLARSMEAQGLRDEAAAVLASVGAPVVAKASRPTLAQLAQGGAVRTVAASTRLELERVSLGEVRLRTAAPQLTTRIVTGEQMRLTPGLTAPIRTVSMAAKPIIVAKGECGATRMKVRLPATGLSISLLSARKSGEICPALAERDKAPGARG